MTIADNFVFLYIPKTGSTFVFNCFDELKKNIKKDKLYYFLNKNKQTFQTLRLPNIKNKYPNQPTDHHGTVKQIPAEHAHKKLVSIIRDPFDAYVSRWKFKSHDKGGLKSNTHFYNQIIAQFPTFPDLTFSEYLSLSEQSSRERAKQLNVRLKENIGLLSILFIQMFADNPLELLSLLDKDFFQKGLHQKYFKPVHFLKNENLNTDLYEFLEKEGYKKKHIDFILEKKKLNVSVSSDNHKNFISEEDKKTILEREWFLFELFPFYKYE